MAASTTEGADAGEDGTGRGTPIVAAFDTGNQTARDDGDVAYTLRDPNGTFGDVCPAVQVGPVVRRLTPLECERLMGWEDHWTRWRADGTELKDGPRYRLCGNGVVGTVSKWLALRLMAVMLAGGDS